MDQLEMVMVVPSEVLTPLLGKENFVTEGVEDILRVIRSNARFVPRPYAEHALEYKQIIPYAVLRWDSRFFLVRRLKGQTEQRLHGMYSLGMGGHINPSEQDAADPILAGMRRELREEVGITAPEAGGCLGIINDLSTDVSNFHIGLLYTVRGDSRVSVSETKKMTGHWAEAEEVDSRQDAMESWSQIVWKNRDRWMA